MLKTAWACKISEFLISGAFDFWVYKIGHAPYFVNSSWFKMSYQVSNAEGIVSQSCHGYTKTGQIARFEFERLARVVLPMSMTPMILWL